MQPRFKNRTIEAMHFIPFCDSSIGSMYIHMYRKETNKKSLHKIWIRVAVHNMYVFMYLCNGNLKYKMNK